MTRAAALACSAALAGCASTGPPANLDGSWGGRGIGLVVENGAGRLDYDCASGTIDALVPAAGGRFTAAGAHVPGQGGPERVGQVVPSYRATYSGEVRGARMTFRATVENSTELGPFTLVRGTEPQLLRCL